MYEYKAKIVKIVDGDTVDVDIDLGFGIVLTDERVRMMGIDTPESRTSDKVEKVFGLAAKDGEDMKGKFGRILGDFIIGDKMLTEILIEEGHAVKYFGQNKADIERGHFANRNKLMNEGKVDTKEVQEAGEKMK